MSFKDLNKEQINQLKQRLYCERDENISYGELTNIDNLVSDEEVKNEYENMLFSEEDFY